MGMCKECGEVFNTIEMTNGLCKNCATPENIAKAKKEDENKKNDLGFQWWIIWAWLNLILGNGFLLSKGLNEFTIILIAINTILMIFVLKYNKYAFLIATILSLNPLLWLINGIYLKNRWNHSKVNPTNSINNLSNDNTIEQLEKLANLKEKGFVTEEEFNAKKQKLLG